MNKKSFIFCFLLIIIYPSFMCKEIDSFQCECLPWNLCKWSYDIAVNVNELAFEAEEERKELTEYFRRFICGDPNDQRVHCCGDQIKT